MKVLKNQKQTFSQLSAFILFMPCLFQVKVYMNRMASYPDWYVSSSRNLDEVPIGHSLTGFATAFDFLYDTFSESERKLYLEKIQIETKHLYTLIVKKKGGWTKQHIHNHAPTNLLATLLGAMVYEEHFPEVGKFLCFFHGWESDFWVCAV